MSLKGFSQQRQMLGMDNEDDRSGTGHWGSTAFMMVRTSRLNLEESRSNFPSVCPSSLVTYSPGYRAAEKEIP